MMRLMGAMEIFTAQQQEDIKDEVQLQLNQDSAYSLPHNSLQLLFGGGGVGGGGCIVFFQDTQK